MSNWSKTLLCLCVGVGWLWATPGFAQEIKAISVVGNQRIETDAILESLQTKPGGFLNSKRIGQDVRGLYGKGYFDNVEIFFDKKSGLLTIAVKEKISIRRVRFVGNEDEDTEDLEKEVRTKSFSYLDENRLREDVDRLRAFYDGKGFYLADIRTEVQPLPNNEANLTFKIEENQKVQVRRITMIGNTVFPDDELKKIIRTQEKSVLSFLSGSGTYMEEMVNQDRQILRDYYGHAGYIQAQVGVPRVELAPDKGSLSIAFVIDEGAQYRVGDVSLQGSLIRPEAELKEKIELKKGGVADTLLIQKDVRSFVEIYSDEGYAYVNVIPRPTFNEEKKTVDITYIFQPGQKVFVERITFMGNESTRDKVLRREMQIMEGDLYRGDKTERVQAEH